MNFKSFNMVDSERIGIGSGPPRASSLHKGDSSAPEAEDEGGGEGNKGEGTGAFVLEGDGGVPLDREKTDMTHRKTAVQKGKRGNPCIRTKWLILIGCAN